MWKYENESSYCDPADRQFRLASPAAGSESAPYSNEPPQRSSSIYRIFFLQNVGVSSSSRRVSMEKSKWSTWRNCTAINVTTCRHTRWEPWIKNEWNAVHSQTIPFKFPPINIQPETCTFVGGFSSNNHFWQAKHRRMVPSAFPRKRFALATRSRCSRSSAGNAIVKTIPLPTRTIFLLKKKTPQTLTKWSNEWKSFPNFVKCPTFTAGIRQNVLFTGQYFTEINFLKWNKNFKKNPRNRRGFTSAEQDIRRDLSSIHSKSTSRTLSRKRPLSLSVQRSLALSARRWPLLSHLFPSTTTSQASPSRRRPQKPFLGSGDWRLAD